MYVWSFNSKAQPLPALLHSKIWPSSTAEQDGRNQTWCGTCAPVNLLSGRCGESVQCERWIRVSESPVTSGSGHIQGCYEKQWAGPTDRDPRGGTGQRPEQEFETRDVFSGSKILLVRLVFTTRTPLFCSQWRAGRVGETTKKKKKARNLILESWLDSRALGPREVFGVPSITCGRLGLWVKTQSQLLGQGQSFSAQPAEMGPATELLDYCIRATEILGIQGM